MAGETILSIAYGLEIQQENDPYLKISEAGVLPLVIAAVPGTFLVDSIPLLKYVPAWFPGASFQRKAREWRKLARTMVEMPYAEAKKDIVSEIFVFDDEEYLLTFNRRNLERPISRWFRRAYRRFKEEQKTTLSPKRSSRTSQVLSLQARLTQLVLDISFLTTFSMQLVPIL
jgi:hypothetical protein